VRIIRVDLHAKSSVFEGWGTSLAWWANAVGRWPRAERDAAVRRLFSLDDGGLGLNVARFNAGGGENPGLDLTMSPRAIMEGYRRSREAAIDPTADPGQRAVLRAAARLVAEQDGELVTEVFGNSPPWWATVSGSVTGSSAEGNLPAPNLSRVFERDYLRYLGDVADLVAHDAGVRVTSISPFNEPTSKWWVLGGRQEGCHFTPEGVDRLLTELSKLPEAQRARTVAASEEWSLDQAVATWDALGPTARGTIGRLSVHTYDGESRAAVRARAERAGAGLWVSEFGEGSQDGYDLAMAIVRDLRELAPSAWVLWQALSQDDWGVLRMAANGPTVDDSPKFAVFARFTRSIRPGMRLVGTDDPHSVAAVRGDLLSVVAVGDADAHERVAIDLGGAATGPAEVVIVDARGNGLMRRELVEDEDGCLHFRLAAGFVASVTVRVTPHQDDGFRGTGSWWLEHESGVRLGLAATGDAELSSGVRLVGVAADDASLGQRWRAEACGDGSVRWVCEASGQQIDIERAYQRPGAHAVQWWAGLAEKAPPHSRFEPTQDAVGAWTLVARHSGLALALDEHGFGVQRPVGDHGTRWRLVRASHI
jgi:O-glycosyl hydrolase